MTTHSTLAEEPVHRVRHSLAAYPAKARLLDACLACLRELDASVALVGSAGRGTADAFSDLDLRVVAPPGERADTVRERLLAALAPFTRPLAVYTGGHLGLAELLIVVLEVDGAVEKLDLHLVGPGEGAPGGVVLWDPAGRFRAGGDAPREEARVTGQEEEWKQLHQRFCGWLWFTWVRIARNEPLAAAASLDFSREHAIIPLLRFALKTTGDEFPTLDRLLPPDLRALFVRTYPARLDEGALLAALAGAADLFEATWSRLRALRGYPPAPGDLTRMTQLIPGLAAHRTFPA